MLTSISSILTPAGRQRQDFEPAALVELAQSIEQRGLIHAILLRPDGKTLVAGERRLRAITEYLYPLGKTFTYNGEPVPAGQIPYSIAASDDPLELEELELDENLRRKDLTWQELATTHARLHELRSKQATVAKAVAPTIAETAVEVFGPDFNAYQHDTIRQEVIVSRYLDRPEVAKAPDLRTAMKVIKKTEDADRNRALAIAVGKTHTAATHKVFHANCLDWMQQPEWQEKFDVILTDPPYGMNAHEFGDAAGKLETIDHQYDDTLENWHALMGGESRPDGDSAVDIRIPGWCELAYKVAKPQAHAYVFCDIDQFPALREYMREAGWYVFRTPLTNFKQNSGRVPLPDRGPRRQSEWCLYAIKGNKNTNYIASDVIVTGSDEQMSHGAQKPVALYDDLLRRSIRPGDWVLDTFAGTGTILPSAHALKCTAVAVEQSQEYYGMCLTRLAALDLQKELL